MLPLGSSLEQSLSVSITVAVIERPKLWTECFTWSQTLEQVNISPSLASKTSFFPPKEIRKFSLPRFLILPLLTCSDLGDYSHKPYLCLDGEHPRFPLGTGATQFLKQLFQTINKLRYRQLMSTISFPNFHKLWTRHFNTRVYALPEEMWL